MAKDILELGMRSGEVGCNCGNRTVYGRLRLGDLKCGAERTQGCRFPHVAPMLLSEIPICFQMHLSA